jgi:3-oxoadipate enol-lactonase
MLSGIAPCEVLEHLGCPLHFQVTGTDRGPTIIFIHGAILDSHMFDLQIASLLTSYRVVSWDLRGHGTSIPSGEDFSVKLAVDDLALIINRVTADKVILIGASLGAMIAQEYASRFPQRVSALVCIGSPCISIQVRPLEGVALRAFHTWGRHTYRGLQHKIVAYFSGVTASTREYVFRSMSSTSPTAERQIWDEVIQSILTYSSNQFYRGKTLLMRGEYDFIYRHMMSEWHNGASEYDNDYVVIPHAGHIANLDNPVFLNSVLEKYLMTCRA